jgi:ADP-dependent NAD(P)H-hydrate dehydratase / NAD(P)H-hydrate epimerase
MTHPLPRALFGRARVPLPTGAEAAAFDRKAIDGGVPQPVLMENAGRAAACVVQRLHPVGRIAVVAGRGNNGGDGVVLARTLAGWGRDVRLVVVGERPDPDPLLHGWGVATRRPSLGGGDPDPPDLTGADVVVDALLGTGTRGAPREPEARAIRAMNECGRPVLSLDVPSGVDADTGAVAGQAVRAALTVAFGAPKRGCLLHPGRERSGRIVAVEIGFPPWSDADASAFLVTPGWARLRRPRRRPATHKNAEGRLLLVAGSPAYGGAAVLSARAALRAGVGFLRVAAPPPLGPLLQGSVPEAVHVDATDEGALRAAVEASDAVAAGPGLGTGSGSGSVCRLLLGAREARPLLLDADALNLLARGGLPEWGEGDAPALLTPHPGEAGRLLGCGAGEIVSDPVGAARRIAGRFGAATLLKGTPSMVATRNGEAPLLVAAGGTSDLARAGMGDVLTGAAGAFLARGAAPEVAAGLGLHFTGRAAELSGAGESVLPTDVIEHLPAALAEEGDGASDLDLPSVILDLPPAR